MNLPSINEISKRDLWFKMGVSIVLTNNMSSHLREDPDIETADVTILVMSAEIRVISFSSALVKPTVFLEFNWAILV